MDNERIILGSGYVHVGEFNKGDTLPDPEAFCTDSNCFSYIQGGAELAYTPTHYEAKDDMGKVRKTIVTEEAVTLKTGLMTFCGNTLAVLCPTARVTNKEAAAGKTARRIVKVGGAENMVNKKYVVVFHHIDKVDGDIWVMIVGSNEAGFTLSFAKDKETVVDAEFKAYPMDSEGTLIHYEEEIPA